MSPGRGSWRLVRAGTDAVPASVRRFMARTRRPPGSRARPWVTVAVVTGLVLVVLWVLGSSPLLGVREVRVTGTDLLTPTQVREAAAVADRTPLLRVDLDDVALRVAGLPPVERAEIRRDWPRTLVVEVVERQPAAAVPVGDEVVVIDRHGVPFQTLTELPPGVPVVIVPGPAPDDPATQAALAVLAELTPELETELAAVTVGGPASIELELRSGRTVVWGDEADSARKAKVASVLLSYQGDVIDVSVPEVVSVR